MTIPAEPSGVKRAGGGRKVSPLMYAAALPMCISWYTTSEGMYQIFPNLPIISRVVAAIIIGVFAYMSNQIGVSLASLKANQRFMQTSRLARAVDIGLRGFLFSVLFFFALFFSFKFYYSALYNSSQRQIEVAQLPALMTAEVLGPLRAEVGAVGKSFADQPDVKNWSQRVAEMANTLSRNRGQADQAFGSQAVQDLQAQGEVQQLQQAVASNQAQKTGLEKQIQQWRDPQQAAFKKLTDAKSRMLQEETGAIGSKRGRGPKYAQAAEDARAAQNDVDYYQSLIDQANGELSGTGGLAEKIAQETSKLAEMTQGGAHLTPRGGFDEALAKLNDAQLAFQAAPSLGNYFAAAKACEAITSVLAKGQNSGLSANFGSDSCASVRAQNALTGLGSRQAALQQFQHDCNAGAINERLSTSAPAAAQKGTVSGMFDFAQTLTNACLTRAEDVGVDTASARARLDNFVAINSPLRDPTTMAVDGLLFRYGRVQAGMAYAFALAQELLILALSFFAEWQRPKLSRRNQHLDLALFEHDPVHIAAAKFILANRQAVKDSSRVFKVDLASLGSDDDNEGIRINVRARLNDLITAELARASDKADEFFIGSDAIEELRDEILQEQANRNGMSSTWDEGDSPRRDGGGMLSGSADRRNRAASRKLEGDAVETPLQRRRDG